MRFLVDAQLPIELARALTAAGHFSVSVREIGLQTAEDELIWNYASRHQLAIVTKDEDFANRVWRTSQGPAVVWLRLGNCSNADLLNKVMPSLNEISTRIEIGDRLVELT